ncbi:MAG: glutamate synthase subunit beta [Bifidobacteriaceae bacterium]|jgi:glutamate synthase (NADPH/NADH) small chain|nr:glutamate synthase subunit beta [Bifidobacteriaceae bacterium]
MGKPTGFLEIPNREISQDRNPLERINDFCDVHSPAKIDDLVKTQASRCMDCGVPFCTFSCPLGNIIPEFNDYVYKGDAVSAYKTLMKTNNFPEFTGRLCPALCESGCNLGIGFNPVTIKNIELSIVEQAFSDGLTKSFESPYMTGKSVAVIGSGPAGLAAAEQLTFAGHSVTVYEKQSKPGGLLRYGIPNFKLEKQIIDRRIDLMKSNGVKFQTGVNVGEDITFDEIAKRYDAVIISIGTQIHNELNIAGRESNNIYPALEYLNGAADEINDNFKDKVQGKNVLIIGGGDTGSDCLGTALRQKANHITTLQILHKPKDERDDYANPWPEYNRAYCESSSMEEGFATNKSEYLYTTTVSKFNKNSNGDLESVDLNEVIWTDGSFQIAENSFKTIPVDIAFLSLGFKGPKTDKLVQQLNLDLNERGNIDVDDTYKTSHKNVFACGDCSHGQSLIVWAIAEGRSAAANVDKFLMGETNLKIAVKPNQRGL